MRLPTHLKPLTYNVSLVPFIIPGNFTIQGSVLMTLKAIESGATNITIHSIATNISHESGKFSRLYYILTSISIFYNKSFMQLNYVFVN